MKIKNCQMSHELALEYANKAINLDAELTFEELEEGFVHDMLELEFDRYIALNALWMSISDKLRGVK